LPTGPEVVRPLMPRIDSNSTKPIRKIIRPMKISVRPVRSACWFAIAQRLHVHAEADSEGTEQAPTRRPRMGQSPLHVAVGENDTEHRHDAPGIVATAPTH